MFTAPQGISDPAVRDAMTALFEKVDAIEGMKVTSPYSPEGARFNSADGTIAFAQLNFTERGQAEAQALGNEIKDLGEGLAVPGLQVEYGGQLFALFEFPESELLGILAAVIILLVAFGSVIAMGLPIGTALFGLGVGVAVVGLGSHLVSMPEFSTQMTAMIGLGVGIDYALFIVTRYRENLHRGWTPEQSTVEAVNSSGRAVLFAGMTVMISLLGLFVIGLDRFIQHRPWPAMIAGVRILVLLALPLLGIRLGFSDTGNLPEEQTARRGYDLLGDGFGEGSNGPLVLVSNDPAANATTVASVDATLASDPGIAFANPGFELSPGTWCWQAYPATSPQDAQTEELVERLRDDTLPGALPVEAWAPMMLFAIVFGLSMDYEVFLRSRMKEEYDRTGDNATAVADGLAATARVITAAALIMVCVFGAFVLGIDRQLKLFGLGMAVAVFIDATVVRMVLVPATMELLGDRNWWMPKWLDRILPKVDVEGHAAPPDVSEERRDREPELVSVRPTPAAP